MGSTARQYHEHDQERQSPQSLARQLTEQDRENVATSRPAPVTVLHGAASPMRPRRPRTARVKTVDQDPANQVHGFAMHGARSTVSTPITGAAPSLVRSKDDGTASGASMASAVPPVSTPRSASTVAAPTAHVAAPVSKAATTVAKPRRSAASAIARAPHFVMDAARWAKHVMLGSGLAFMERVPEVLSPVAFVFANLVTIVIGLAYCALPAGMGLFLLAHSPALHDAFLVNGPMKIVYMGLLYITCGFVALVGAFALRALALGLVRTLNGFAAKGQTAFSD